MAISKEDYVYQNMLTCIGNKRKLIDFISESISNISKRLNKKKMKIVDGFLGSTVVSRELMYYASHLYVNDLEKYSYMMGKCYLKRPTPKNQEKIQNHIQIMNTLAENGPYVEGIISRLYAPKDTEDVKEGERCFYTRENALIIDTLRQYIKDEVEKGLQYYCLVPLLTKASIHANTAGVFKGFYKDGKIGCFGGAGKNALSRILKEIRLEMPIWNNLNCKVKCYNKDINELITELPNDIDVMYLDPPYNQHPYGSNYFMLNVIAKYEEPESISRVSGIPSNWKRSNYNSRSSAIKSMKALITEGLTKSKYLLISYNNEGIIKKEDWEIMLEGYNVEILEKEYNTYRGSRNLKNRKKNVLEQMYLIYK